MDLELVGWVGSSWDRLDTCGRDWMLVGGIGGWWDGLGAGGGN